MNFELLVPISLFAAIAYSIKAVVDARVRKQLVASNGAPWQAKPPLAGRPFRPNSVEATALFRHNYGKLHAIPMV